MSTQAGSLGSAPLQVGGCLDLDSSRRRLESSRPREWNDDYNLMSEIVDDHIWDGGPQRRCRPVTMRG